MDCDFLRQLTTLSVAGATIDAISTAISSQMIHGSVLIIHISRTTERDAFPQAADYLAMLERVQTAIVFGITDEAIHLSARSTDPRVDIGDALQAAFADVGSAGGHQDMTGGEAPSLGIFAEYTTDDTQLLAIVEQVITARLVAGLNLTGERDEPVTAESERYTALPGIGVSARLIVTVVPVFQVDRTPSCGRSGNDF